MVGAQRARGGDQPIEMAYSGLLAGNADAGLAAVTAALDLARRERSLFYEPELHRLDGALHAAAGRADVAEACLRRGLAVAREQGSRTLELRIATELARIAVHPAAAAEARALVATARAGFEEGHGTRDLLEAVAVLAPAAQAMTPEAASASTSTPSPTR